MTVADIRVVLRAMQPFVMFDTHDGALEERKAEQPIGSALCLRVGCGERLDTYKEREQAASDFRFHGGGQMFLGWIKR